MSGPAAHGEREPSLLARVLEGEVMDTAAEARDYDAMDHRGVNQVFVADLLDAQRAAGLPPDALLLDLGTGTAQIPIELCRQNPQARVIAVDLAAEMLALAEANVAAAGLAGQIIVEQVDAKRLPYAARAFAGVISNSIVHHIPEPAGVLADAVRVVRRGGLIFFRDLARPRDEQQWSLQVARYTLGANDHQRQLFADSLRAALDLREVREMVAQLGFDAEQVRMTSDRHWTWSAIRG